MEVTRKEVTAIISHSFWGLVALALSGQLRTTTHGFNEVSVTDNGGSTPRYLYENLIKPMGGPVLVVVLLMEEILHQLIW